MQGDDTLHDQEVRDGMGLEGIHSTTAQQKTVFQVIRWAASLLPESYRNLILSRWMRSLRYGNDYFKLAASDSYYDAYGRYINRLMASPGATVRLAVLGEDHDLVLGFSLSRGSVLDYVHVQADMRRQGIGRSLVPADIDTITHLTRTGATIWGSNKTLRWKFNPFA